MTNGRPADGQLVTVVDLAQPVHPAIPHSPNHPGYRQALLRLYLTLQVCMPLSLVTLTVTSAPVSFIIG